MRNTRKIPLCQRNHIKLAIYISIFLIQIIELIASFESEIHRGSISQQSGANFPGKFREVTRHVSIN